MVTQTSKPTRTQRFDIRCNVADAMNANVAVHIVFFFNRRLNVDALGLALARALTTMPMFAGRMTMRDGGTRIRCYGQGVPFTSASSDCTLDDAIRSLTQDSGDWLIDPVNGFAARWGFGPLCKIRITDLAGGATAIGVSWHHLVGDMQTLMIFMRAWAAAAAGQSIAEPLIVEDRASYLDEHLPAGGASEPNVRCLGFLELGRSARYVAKNARTQRTVSFYFGDDELARMRDTYGSRMRLSANDVVCAHVCELLMSADPAAETRTLAIAGEPAKSVWPRSNAGWQYGHGSEIRPATQRGSKVDRRTYPPLRGSLCRRALRHTRKSTVPRCRGSMAGRSVCGRCIRSGPMESGYHELERLRRLSPSI